MLSHFWEFLRDRSNRDIISWIGGGAFAIIAALWTVYTYFVPSSRFPEPQETAKPTAVMQPFTEQAKAESKAGNIDRAEALKAIALYTASAVTMMQDRQRPDLALDYLREAEDRLKSITRATSAKDQLLQGYIYKTYAQAYAQSGENAQADEYRDKAIKAFELLKNDPELNDRERAGAMNGIGNFYHAQKKYKKAIDYYKQATELQPDYAYAWHDMFAAYLELARDGDVDLPAMREALHRTKDTAQGYPGLDPKTIAQLEAGLRDFEQSSRP